MYYLNSAKKWWTGKTQPQTNDLLLRHPLIKQESSWHNTTQQVLKGAALVGVGVVGYLGLSTLLGKRKQSELASNKNQLSAPLESTDELLAEFEAFNENANTFVSLSSLGTGRTLLSRSKKKEIKDDLRLSYQAQEGSQHSPFDMSSSRRALVSNGGCEFRVNTYTTNTQGYLGYLSVASLTGGGFVVTWDSNGQDGNGDGIYGQRYNSTGETVGNEFQVNTYTTSFQGYSSVVGLTDGGFVVAWHSVGQDGSGDGIYGQRYDTRGIKAGSEFQINTYTTSWRDYPSVTSLTDGGFVVVWTSDGQDGDIWGIYGQRYNSTGETVGNEFQVNTYTTSWQRYPSVVGLSNAGFVVTWESYGPDGEFWGIYGQCYNLTGGKVSNEFQVNTYTTGTQRLASVAGLTNGGFVVTWDSYGQDGSGNGIYGQSYNTTGGAVGNEFQVNTYTNDHQYSPSVVGLTDGGFVVAWYSYGQDGSLAGIYGQRYNASGGTVDNEFQVNSYTTNLQQRPSIAGLTNGGFVVTWQSDGQDGDSGGIYGRISTSALCIVANTLTISEGQTVHLTTATLDVVDWIGSTSGSLLNFTVTNIQHGFFDSLSNPGVPITSFTLKEIKNNQTRFTHDGSESAPTYDVKASNGGIETSYQAASITFINVNDRPELLQNKLTIKQGERVTLNNNMLSATDTDNNDTLLIFTVREDTVRNGQFERINDLGRLIFTFTQQEIMDGNISFVHNITKRESPSYEIKVTDGKFETSYQSANITFSPNINEIFPYEFILVGSGILVGLVCIGTLSAIVVVAGGGICYNKIRRMNKKKTEKVLKQRIEEIEMEPQHAETFYHRAKIHEELKQYEAALKNYNNAITYDCNRKQIFEDRRRMLIEGVVMGIEDEFATGKLKPRLSQASRETLKSTLSNLLKQSIDKRIEAGKQGFGLFKNFIKKLAKVLAEEYQVHRKLIKAKSHITGLEDKFKKVVGEKINLAFGHIQSDFISDDIVIAMDNKIKMLGNGGQGSVYEGYWHGIEVAIKRINFTNEKEEAQENFKKEAYLMKTLSHPNIIAFREFLTYKNGYCIVMEKLDSLKKRSKATPALTWSQRIEIAIGIIRGMQYLHKKGIFHRDIKIDNVLVDKQLCPKLIDFGLSILRKPVEVSQGIYQVCGTPTHLDPYLNGKDVKYSAKSDIYSYGMTLWELATGKPPYIEKTKELISVYSYIVAGGREKIPNDWPKEYARLIRRCWDGDPNNRPDIAEILKILENLKVKLSERSENIGGLDSNDLFNNRSGMFHHQSDVPQTSRRLTEGIELSVEEMEEIQLRVIAYNSIEEYVKEERPSTQAALAFALQLFQEEEKISITEDVTAIENLLKM